MRSRNGIWSTVLSLVAAAAAAIPTLAQPAQGGGAAAIENRALAESTPATPAMKTMACGLSLVAKEGLLEAVRPDGTTVWSMPTLERKAPTWARLNDRLIELDNGWIIDVRNGALLARSVPIAADDVAGNNRNTGDKDGGMGSRGVPYWGELQLLGDVGLTEQVLFENNSINGTRHAWLLQQASDPNDPDSGTAVGARRSIGHDSFGDPVVIMSPSNDNDYRALAAAALDPDDNLTVIARARNESGISSSCAYAARYEPGTGWSDETLIYTGDKVIWVIVGKSATAAADADGNVVVVLPFQDWTATSVYYDAAADTWTEIPIPFGARSGVVVYPAVVGNRTGTAIYLFYEKYLTDRTGTYFSLAFYCNRFDLATKQWSAPELIPGTAHAYSLHLRHVVVDDAGEATMLWVRSRVKAKEAGMWCASRTEQGVWQAPEELASLKYKYYDLMDDFGDIDVNAAGDVIAVFPTTNDIEGGYGVWLHAARYRAGVGWDAVQYPMVYDDWGYITRSRVCFYNDDKAVATTISTAGGIVHLTSLLYDGTSWSQDAVELPEDDAVVYFQESAGAQGTAVLIHDPTGSNEYSSTWLRDAP